MNQIPCCTTLVGIDLARRAAHKAVLMPAEGPRRGMPGRAWEVTHSLAGLERLCERIRGHTGRATLEGVLVNMEPTSGVWPVVGAYLRLQGAKVCLTRTDLTSQWRKVHSRYRKSDRIDAQTLASVPLSFPDRVWEARPVPEAVQTLRELSAQRQRLVEEITRWKNRFEAAVEPVWTVLLAQLKAEQTFSGVVRAFFRRFANPCDVVSYGRARFTTWYGKHAHGLTDPELAQTLWNASESAAALWRAFEKDNALPWSPASLLFVIEQDLRTIEYYEEELRGVEARIETARQEVSECALIEEMPGAGPVVSVTLAALLMPASRFASARQCGAYTGFTPRKSSSAGKDTPGLRITKTGNRRLKRDLALSANTAMYYDPELASFAIRLLKKGKHYNEVRVAVGRKIALRARALLRRAADDPQAGFEWRDLQGNVITEQEAKAQARRLWEEYRSKNPKGPSASAPSGPSTDAPQLTLTQPGFQYAQEAVPGTSADPQCAHISPVDNSALHGNNTVEERYELAPV